MRFLASLLTFPISGPIGGALWVARQVHGAAERELSDPARLRRALAELEARLDAGEIGEEEFEAREAELIARLRAGTGGGGR